MCLRSACLGLLLASWALCAHPLAGQGTAMGGSSFPVPGVPEARGAEPLDLNLASAKDLASLDGMGPVYARRVVEGRPYRAKNQLVTRGILPAEAYNRIRDHIVAHRNTAGRP